MYDCDCVYEEVMRLRREDLHRKLDRAARHNHYPKASKKSRNSAKLSLFMVFFRNVMMK